MSDGGACPFCGIAQGKIPARIVYMDEQAVAFEDINPKAPIHILIVPRNHIVGVSGMTDGDRELVGHLFRVAAKVAADMGFESQGYRLVINNGRGAGQVVFHLHLHVLAGRRFSWPPG